MMPDKIYIHRKDLSYSEVKESDSDIVFIRKDALLEWARIYKEEADALARGRTDNLSWGESVAMKNLIDEINSL